MSKNKIITKELKAFLLILGMFNVTTILLPILLTFYLELFLARTLITTDGQEPAGSGFVELITFLASIGIFVLVINIITTLILLKRYKLSSKQVKATKILLSISLLLPLAYFASVIALRFI